MAEAHWEDLMEMRRIFQRLQHEYQEFFAAAKEGNVPAMENVRVKTHFCLDQYFDQIGATYERMRQGVEK